MTYALSAMLAQTWATDEATLGKLIEIASREHQPSPEALEAYRSQSLARAERATVRDGVAIVSVEGPLFKRANLMTQHCGATAYETVRRDLQAAVDDPGVRAILLNVDSPGGEAAGVGELAAAVRGFRGGKPIVAYVGDLGASAAYWLASAADSIVIGASAALGSIGVRASYADTSARDERSGVRRYEFVSSQSPFKKADLESDEGRARVQARVDTLAQVFVDTVADNRGVSVEHVLAAFGKGDVLIGRAAVEGGMADEIGTFEGTLAALAGGQTRFGSGRKQLVKATLQPTPARAAKPTQNVAASKPAATAISPVVLAERARAQAIIAMTPKGAEAEAEQAIRSGMSIDAFEAKLAARAIIAATHRVRGSAAASVPGKGRDAASIVLDAVRRAYGH